MLPCHARRSTTPSTKSNSNIIATKAGNYRGTTYHRNLPSDNRVHRLPALAGLLASVR